jgi:hypothetical protein
MYKELVVAYGSKANLVSGAKENNVYHQAGF